MPENLNNKLMALNYFMGKNTKVDCLECGSKNAFVVSDSRYCGFRGLCPNCKGNWPES